MQHLIRHFCDCIPVCTNLVLSTPQQEMICMMTALLPSSPVLFLFTTALCSCVAWSSVNGHRQLSWKPTATDRMEQRKSLTIESLIMAKKRPTIVRLDLRQWDIRERRILSAMKPIPRSSIAQWHGGRRLSTTHL